MNDNGINQSAIETDLRKNLEGINKGGSHV